MSMRLAIADPPYLGRANRWYGTGRGSAGGRHKADTHPAARVWDDPNTHVDLVRELVASYDGWAIALNVDALSLYLSVCPPDVHVMVWHRRNASPSGSALRNVWEPVIVRIPPGRGARTEGITALPDLLDISAPRIGFAGAKPAEWTRWVLTALGYDPNHDELTDLFGGSGSVAGAADGMIW